MNGHYGETTRIQENLDRWLAGNQEAYEELVNSSCTRFRQLVAKMFNSYSRFHRFADTDDIMQGALLRLHRSLRECRPQTVKRYFALSAEQINRELVDLARRKKKYELALSAHENEAKIESPAAAAPEPTPEQVTLAHWTEFHERVSSLPEEQKQIVYLHFYCDRPLVEVASMLGMSASTAKRRWRDVRLALVGYCPGMNTTAFREREAKKS